MAQEKPEVRWFAVVDESPGAALPGQLIDFEKRECLVAEHVRSPGKFPVPVGCDLALKRYRLVKKSNGRETFEAIYHAKDAGSENKSHPPEVLLARAILEVASADGLSDGMAEALQQFLDAYPTTFDGSIR